MTVAELIEKLKAFDGAAPVHVPHWLYKWNDPEPRLASTEHLSVSPSDGLEENAVIL